MHAEPGEKSSYIDLINKCAVPVIVAIITLIGYYVATYIQSRMSAATIISQREQAESQLRATMFKDLIGPIIGTNDPEKISIEHERLLSELLALNFGENFEFKPLLKQVDEKLAKRIKEIKGKKQREKIMLERESLRSVARRVISRQIATILNMESKTDKTEIQTLNIFELPQNDKQRKDYEELKKDLSDQKYKESGVYFGEFGDEIQLESPDKNHTLDISITSCKWDNETCEVYFRTNHKSQENGKKNNEGEQPHFTLTWFDFPFTDNTLLDDGNRFAVVINQFSAPDGSYKSVVLKVIWFPKIYFTPRERPINYADIRDKLGFKQNRVVKK